MPVQAGQMAHTGFVVRDVAKMAEFYSKGLGLKQLHANMDRYASDSSGTLDIARVHMRIVTLGLGGERDHALELIEFLDPVGQDQHQAKNGIGHAPPGALCGRCSCYLPETGRDGRHRNERASGPALRPPFWLPP